MSDIPESLADIDAQIAAVRENLRELVQQAAGYSGAGDDELTARRIAEQEARLEQLKKRRARLSSDP